MFNPSFLPNSMPQRLMMGQAGTAPPMTGMLPNQAAPQAQANFQQRPGMMNFGMNRGNQMGIPPMIMNNPWAMARWQQMMAQQRQMGGMMNPWRDGGEGRSGGPNVGGGLTGGMHHGGVPM